ncbi:hypothetical protein ACVIHH_008354 [Bradyrhizobium sp. USDA 4518]
MKSFWLGRPAFADVLVGCETLQGLQSPGVIVGCDEVGKVSFELIVSIVMVALESRFRDRAVHALDLAIESGTASIAASSLCAQTLWTSSAITTSIPSHSNTPSPPTTSSLPSNASADTMRKLRHRSGANFWFKTLDLQ